MAYQCGVAGISTLAAWGSFAGILLIIGMLMMYLPIWLLLSSRLSDRAYSQIGIRNVRLVVILSGIIVILAALRLLDAIPCMPFGPAI
jgi:hypothetical protein